MFSFSGDSFSSDGVSSIVIHPISKQTYVFSLCQDYKIRVWNCQVGFDLNLDQFRDVYTGSMD